MGSAPKYSIEYGNMASFLILGGPTLLCSSSELLQIVKKKEMIILILPSHTKAVLQPPDRKIWLIQNKLITTLNSWVIAYKNRK